MTFRIYLNTSLLIFALANLTGIHKAWAASFYVEDSIHDINIGGGEARGTTDLVRQAVGARPGDTVVGDVSRATYLLQPRLTMAGEAYLLTIEKRRGTERVFVAQSKLSSLDDLDLAARSVANAVIDETQTRERVPAGAAPYQATTQETRIREKVNPPATTASEAQPANASPSSKTVKTITSTAVEVLPPKQLKASSWTVGAGPFLSRNLRSDRAMFEITGGHKWNLNRQVALQAGVEAAFSTARDQAQLYGFSLGGQYSLVANDKKENTALIFAFDLGYGYAHDAEGNKAEGLTIGGGTGFAFLRNTAISLDVLLRATALCDHPTPDSGVPTILGVRIALNF